MATFLKAFFANFLKWVKSLAHLVRNPGEQFTFTDHLSTEHRLGPHSTETVTHSHSFGASAFIVSMQQEMYNDALHFFREARTNHTKKDADPFTTWRSLRATILFSFAAIESCINQFIDEYIDRNKATLAQKDAAYWTEKPGFVSINKKLNEGVLLFGGKRLDADSALWQEYTELKDLRNGLVHYKVANRLFYNTDELLKRAEKGIRTTSAVIKKIYLAHPANTAYPKGFDELP
jgi:hypothetical protein